MTRLLTNKRLRANLLLAVACLALPGCTLFTLPPASGVEPLGPGQAYPIQRASGEGPQAAWPNLADVPAKSDNPLPAEAAAQQLGQLEADRAAAQARAAGGVAPSAPVATITVPVQAPSPPPEL